MSAKHKVVLLRHAESAWNLENRFTGWTDVDLSPLGVEEAHQAGRLLRLAGFRLDIAFTSRLHRALRTLKIILEELQQPDVPIVRAWELNERHYGALQGLNKLQTKEKYGAEQFQRWRRGFYDRPPALAADDPRHPRFDPLYGDVDPAVLPATESLADTYTRTIAFWEQSIAPQIRQGRTVIVVAHGNTFRALGKYLDNLSDKDVETLEIPTGRPLIYELDVGLAPLRHYYLGEKPEAAPSVSRAP